MDVIVSYPGVWSFALHGLCGTCKLGGTDDHCDEAAEKMSKAGPEVVDKVTHNGEIASEGELSSITGQVLGRR